MKLKELTLANYKGFIDFTTTFDQGSAITTIIGQNGVGKSNLIEVIVSIFRSLDLGEQTDFSYVLNYECRGHDIQVGYDIKNKNNNSVIINNIKKSFSFL